MEAQLQARAVVMMRCVTRLALKARDCAWSCGGGQGRSRIAGTCARRVRRLAARMMMSTGCVPSWCYMMVVGKWVETRC